MTRITAAAPHVDYWRLALVAAVLCLQLCITVTAGMCIALDDTTGSYDDPWLKQMWVRVAGVFIAQPALVAVWAVFGPSSRMQRWLQVSLALAAIDIAFGLPFRWISAYPGAHLDSWTSLVATSLAMLLLYAAPLALAGRLWRYRLALPADETLLTPRQFSLRAIWLYTTCFCSLLTAARFLPWDGARMLDMASRFDWLGSFKSLTSTVALQLIPVFLYALGAFAVRHTLRWYLAAFALHLVLEFAYATWKQPGVELAGYVSLAQHYACFSLNIGGSLLLLRFAGYRWVRSSREKTTANAAV